MQMRVLSTRTMAEDGDKHKNKTRVGDKHQNKANEVAKHKNDAK